MPEPKIPVSVIVPNFNSGSYLLQSIQSINSGLWPEEILIIDDCSTDGSLELAIKIQEQYQNVRVLKQKVNCGAAEARRLGIAKATQLSVAFVDADDLIETDALKQAYIEMMASDSDICIWELWRFDADNKWKHQANPSNFPKTGSEAVLLTLGGWRIHGLGVSRKWIYESAYQGFDESGFNADELLTRLVFDKANKIVKCDKKYFYRVNPSSTTSTLTARSVTALRSHLWLLEFARRYPDAPIKRMVRDAIGAAWFYWRRRRRIGVAETLRELRLFFQRLYFVPGLFSSILQSPKHLAGLLFLSVAIWVKF